MTRGLQRKFSLRFEGVIWNTLASPANSVLLLEVRDPIQKHVTFSALNYLEEKFLWKDKQLEESWWVDLSGVAGNVVLFTIYIDTQNPDSKGLMACSLDALALLWSRNDFSITNVTENAVEGIATKLGTHTLRLDLQTGKEISDLKDSGLVIETLHRPHLYEESSPYFETVKTFLSTRLNFSPVAALEYVEYRERIFISCYAQEEGLVNYLFVLANNGSVQLQEKLDEQLKGIGRDTFFILDGCLFFVKNKRKLLSYFL